MGSNTGTCIRGRKSSQGLELLSLDYEGTAANLSGQVLSSGAWHGLCCPSLPLSSSLSVPKLPCPGSCAAPGLPDCTLCLWISHSWAGWALLVPEVWKEVAEVTPFQNLESENCGAGMLLMDSPFTGRHLGFFSASASLQHSHTHWW